MRSSDWSSDVCSSDLRARLGGFAEQQRTIGGGGQGRELRLGGDLYGADAQLGYEIIRVAAIIRARELDRAAIGRKAAPFDLELGRCGRDPEQFALSLRRAPRGDRVCQLG